MKNQEVTIRLATENDYEALMIRYKELYALHSITIPEPHDLTPETPLRRGSYLNILEDEDDVIYVAECDETLIGFINFSIENVDSSRYNSAYQRVSIDELFVTNDFRRQGIGRLLITKAEEFTHKREIDDITLIAYSFNVEAISFYESEGYSSFSVRMQKKL